MSPNRKGAVAEFRVASKLAENGWNVCFPVSQNCRYDLIAEKAGEFLRIQVKYVTPNKGGLNVNCYSANNRIYASYTVSEIDTIAVYDSSSGEIYFIPASKMNKGKFKIRKDPPKNNQSIGINLLVDQLTIPTK